MNPSMTFIPGWGFKESVWQNLADYLSVGWAKRSVPTTPPGGHAALSPPYNALIAWSFGGLEAIQHCATHPTHFTHLILIASTPRFMRDENWEGLSEQQAVKQLAAAEQDMPRYLQQFLRLATHPQKLFKEQIDAHMVNREEPFLLPQLRMLFTADLRDKFTNLTLPILQIISENDLVTRPQQSLQCSSLRPHQHRVIPNAGHMALYTHPEEVANHIQDFLC